MRVEDLRPLALLDGLDDDQVGQLVSDGEEMPIVPGSDLFHEGEHADSWWVLVDGALDLVRAVGGEETVVRRMDTPGQWAGGFRAWDESGVYLATGRGAVPGRMLRACGRGAAIRCTPNGDHSSNSSRSGSAGTRSTRPGTAPRPVAR